MLYCQQCGAGNADDARFCNQCGGKIADAGEPGGPLATDATQPDTLAGFDDTKVSPERAAVDPQEHEREPPPHASQPSLPSTPSPMGSSSFDVSMVSLSSIGVRSRGKAWGVIVLAVLGLVGLGAGGTWLAMRPSASDPVASADETQDLRGTEEVEIGDLLPEGAEPPEVVTGTPRPAEGGGGSAQSGSARPSKSTGGAQASSGGGASRSGSSSGSSAGGSSGGSSAGGSSGGSGGSSAGGSGGSSGGSSAGGSGGSTSGGSSGGGTRAEPDWDSLEEEMGEEPDYEMDDYSTRVRNFVRTYYAQRAQNCFELATRNHDSVRGTVLIGFRIDADGEISRAEIVRNTTGIDTLGACLRAQVDSWRLPPPPEGRAPLPMQMPFSR